MLKWCVKTSRNKNSAFQSFVSGGTSKADIRNIRPADKCGPP